MKYFTREVKIGLTGIVAIAALFFGLNFLKGINLFQSSNSYYIAFSDAKGLTQSSPVYANGYNIGIVRDILYDYNRPGNVLILIDADAKLRIPEGSSATLVSEMLGGCTMNLILNPNGQKYLNPGDTIQGQDSNGLMEKAETLVPKVNEIMNKVDTLLTTLNTLSSNPDLPVILANTKAITENLNASSQQLNKLLRNDVPTLTGKLNHVSDNVITLTDNLNDLDLQSPLQKADSTLNYLQLMTSKLNRKDNTLGLLLNDTTLYGSLNETVGSANNLLIDLKEHPKRYVHFSIFGRKDK